MDSVSVLDVGDAGCAAVVEISESLRSLPAGAVLEIVTTDPTTGYDLEPWARLSGHEYLGAVRKERAYHLFVRRGPSP